MRAYNIGVTISIPDDILARAGFTERDALIELACRLFDADRLEKPDATRLCGLSRTEFEAELFKRGLAVYRTSLAEYEQDRKSFEDDEVRKAG